MSAGRVLVNGREVGRVVDWSIDIRPLSTVDRAPRQGFVVDPDPVEFQGWGAREVQPTSVEFSPSKHNKEKSE